MSVYIESKSDKRIRQTASFTVLILALSSGILSYNSLRELAIQSGIPPMLAFLFPITLDGLILAGSLLILYFAVRGKRSGYGFFLTSLGVIASIAGNVVVSPDNLTYQILHATSPVVLFLSLESLMILLRARSKNAEKVEAEHKAKEEKEQARKEAAATFPVAQQPATQEPVKPVSQPATATPPVTPTVSQSLPAREHPKPAATVEAVKSSIVEPVGVPVKREEPETVVDTIPAFETPRTVTQPVASESTGKHTAPIAPVEKVSVPSNTSDNQPPSKREVIKDLLIQDPHMDANVIVDIVGGDRKYVRKLIKAEREKILV